MCIYTKRNISYAHSSLLLVGGQGYLLEWYTISVFEQDV